MTRTIKDLTGRRFGRLTVLSLSPDRTPAKKARWLVECDCGIQKTVAAGNLGSGSTVSCGCLGRENQRKSATKSGYHVGGRSITAFRRWNEMMRRCHSENHIGYQNYGGRGIDVAPEWHSFDNFYRDMGDPPKGKQLDRIDNDRGYSKENCRWATQTENCRNKSNNRTFIVDGERLTLSECAERFQLPANTIRGRLSRGWPLDRALGRSG
jgi:hypothetical protein